MSSDTMSAEAAQGLQGSEQRPSRARGTARSRRRVPQTQRAYDELKLLILENRMPAGTQALEQEVARQLNMSRTPVREALIRLARSEEHTSELPSLMRISYAVFCMHNKQNQTNPT